MKKNHNISLFGKHSSTILGISTALVCGAILLQHQASADSLEEPSTNVAVSSEVDEPIAMPASPDNVDEVGEPISMPNSPDNVGETEGDSSSWDGETGWNNESETDEIEGSSSESMPVDGDVDLENSSDNGIGVPVETIVVVSSGTSGTCYWDIVQEDTDYVLNIYSGVLGVNDWYDIPWLDYRYPITKIDIHKGVVANENSRYLFAHLPSLKSIDGLYNLDTSKVTDMSYMFYHANSLTSLDLSSFNTSKVTDMSYMFYYANSLTSLDLSSFNTSKVTDMSYMFYYAISLKNLDLSRFNTSNVTNMRGMFYYAISLKKLDLSSFDTSNVEYMDDMFSNASSLTSLNLSHFYTPKLTDMAYMFCHTDSLTSLNLSNFNTSKANTKAAFIWTPSLHHLVLGPNVTNTHCLPEVVAGNSVPNTNKVVISPNWVAVSGTDKNKRFSSEELSNAKRDRVTVYEWDTGQGAADTVYPTEVKSITRTINIQKPNGTVERHLQRALIKRSKISYADGTVVYGEWSKASWDAYNVPQIYGYTASHDVVQAVDVDEYTANQTVYVTYKKNQFNLTINYIDMKGQQIIGSQSYTCNQGETITPQYDLPYGYKLASIPPKTVTLEDGNQVLNIYVNHVISFSEEAHSIARLIQLHLPDGSIDEVTQWVTLWRSVKTDEATGKKTYGRWSTGYFDEYEVPYFEDYKPSQSVVEEMPVSIYDFDQIVDIYYI